MGCMQLNSGSSPLSSKLVKSHGSQSMSAVIYTGHGIEHGVRLKVEACFLFGGICYLFLFPAYRRSRIWIIVHGELNLVVRATQ